MRTILALRNHEQLKVGVKGVRIKRISVFNHCDGRDFMPTDHQMIYDIELVRERPERWAQSLRR